MKKNNQKGSDAFNHYYESVYGGRWESIRQSFEKEPVYFEITAGLVSPYFIDRASLYPVSALDITPGMNILDMCAAPGGKTLLIAPANGEGGSVTANDRSSGRRNRLLNVLDTCLPQPLRSRVRVTGHDASRWGIHEKNIYDRILLDAPCSSERHVYLSAAQLETWSPARSRQLAERQFAMLAAALDAVKSGGRIVYSTCSVSPAENDRNIEKLFRKRKGVFICSSSSNEAENTADDISGSSSDRISLIEKTEFGFQIMPDSSGGAGPIYFSVIIKL